MQEESKAGGASRPLIFFKEFIRKILGISKVEVMIFHPACTCGAAQVSDSEGSLMKL